MIDKVEIYNFLKNQVEKKAAAFDVTLDTPVDENFSIVGSGLFDSLDFMNLISDVEQRFGVEVDFSEYEPEYFTSIGGFINCVK